MTITIKKTTLLNAIEYEEKLTQSNPYLFSLVTSVAPKVTMYVHICFFK